jgi:hypothetical protein
MKLISPYVHGMLDYLTFISMLILPLTLKLNGRPEFILIAFALFQFILAVVTRYPLGATRQVPFPVHGVIDLISGVLLLAAPWILGFTGMTDERNYYIVLGVYFLLVWVLTDFRGDTAPVGTESPA